MSELAAAEAHVNGLVQDYLEACGLAASAEAFSAECNRLGRGVHPPTPLEGTNDDADDATQQQVLTLFDGGRRSAFFQTLESLTPPSVLESVPYQRLEFLLNVYFAMFPLRHGRLIGSAAGYMTAFRDYLESKGKHLSGTEELLPFFALPYIPDPSKHPSFRDLLQVHPRRQEPWSASLRTEVAAFVRDMTGGAGSPPLLLQLYLSRDLLARQAHHLLVRSHDRLLETQRYYKRLRRRFHRLQDDYRRLTGVAGQLTTALEVSVRQGGVDLDATLRACCQIFPQLFSRTLQQHSTDRHKTSPEAILRQSVERHQADSVLAEETRYPLDYVAVRRLLSTGTGKAQALLLQALRRRVTRATSRTDVVTAYVSGDLLGLAEAGEYTRHVLSALTPPEPHLVQQGWARLLNCLASFSAGRTYLCQFQPLLDTLLKVLQYQKLDATTLDMVLATLQKLSLRRLSQTRMIEWGMVEWLVGFLQDHASIPPYTLECGCALLMNLCLRTAGRHKCVPHVNSVLKLLTDLLASENAQVLPYVNGSLYSLLGHPEIRARAAKLGLGQILEYFMDKGSTDLRRQLAYIMRQYRGEGVDSAASDADDDDTDDAEFLEEDIDADDPVVAENGEQEGEELLATLRAKLEDAESASAAPALPPPSHPRARSRPPRHERRGAEQPAQGTEPLKTDADTGARAASEEAKTGRKQENHESAPPEASGAQPAAPDAERVTPPPPRTSQSDSAVDAARTSPPPVKPMQKSLSEAELTVKRSRQTTGGSLERNPLPGISGDPAQQTVAPSEAQPRATRRKRGDRAAAQRTPARAASQAGPLRLLERRPTMDGNKLSRPGSHAVTEPGGPGRTESRGPRRAAADAALRLDTQTAAAATPALGRVIHTPLVPPGGQKEKQNTKHYSVEKGDPGKSEASMWPPAVDSTQSKHAPVRVNGTVSRAASSLAAASAATPSHSVTRAETGSGAVPGPPPQAVPPPVADPLIQRMPAPVVQDYVAAFSSRPRLSRTPPPSNYSRQGQNQPGKVLPPIRPPELQ